MLSNTATKNPRMPRIFRQYINAPPGVRPRRAPGGKERLPMETGWRHHYIKSIAGQ
jgi:hypothetical protein